MVKTFLINQGTAWLKHENIRKLATGQEDDYTTGCLLDYSYFKDHYKMIAIDLSKQQAMMSIQEQFKKLILRQI